MLAHADQPLYRSAVAANSATRFGRRSLSRRNSAPITIAGAFFTPVVTCYGGCAQDAFGRAGFLDSRSTNLRTAATLTCLVASGGGSSNQGATPMNIFALSPSDIQHKIERHRARAIAQLNTNSSLKVRTDRYNAEMARARFYEAMLRGAK